MTQLYLRVLTGASCAMLLLSGCETSESVGVTEQDSSTQTTIPEELAFAEEGSEEEPSPIPEVEESVPATETVPPATETVPPAPEENSGFSPSQQNAVRSAEDYLEYSAFSRQGLIDQLSSEYGGQYPLEDATIAVDSLAIDWHAQAVRSAEDYLEYSAFSCQGLIDQLSSEYGGQYTLEEATHGANNSSGC